MVAHFCFISRIDFRTISSTESTSTESTALSPIHVWGRRQWLVLWRVVCKRCLRRYHSPSQRNQGKFSVDQGGRRSGGNLLRQNSEAGFEACITKILARQFGFHQLIPVPHVRSRNIQSMQRYIILDEESHEDVERDFRERLASFEMVRPPMDPSSSEAF